MTCTVTGAYEDKLAERQTERECVRERECERDRSMRWMWAQGLVAWGSLQTAGCA